METKDSQALRMPEGADDLFRVYRSAKRGDEYWKTRKEAREFLLGVPLFVPFSAFLTWMAGKGGWDLYYDDPLRYSDVHVPIVGVVLMATSVVMSFFSLWGVWELLRDGVIPYFKLVFGKKYAHRRMPVEEEILQDRLTLDAIELSRQVEVYNQLLTEIRIQEEMVEADLPTDIDLARVRLIEGALREELEPKLLQLAVLIKRFQHRSSAETVDLAVVREVLGDKHTSVIAQLKTQHELGGDPALETLHRAIAADDLNAQLGDPGAFARKLAAKRQTQ